MQVDVFFMGEPRLFIDRERKIIGKKKLEALLFYLLFHEQTDRSETSSVFWPHYDAVRARASLRNSLYQIRELLGVDLFRASTRERIILSAEIRLTRDVDLLLAGTSQPVQAEGRAPIFMHNRELRNNAVYESWLLSVRATYQRVLTHHLKDALHQARQDNNRSECHSLAHQILDLEPYDEGTLRLLMQQLRDDGRHNDALGLFQQMKKLLSRDLGVEPEPETVELAQALREKKRRAEEVPSRGEDPLLQRLQAAWRSYQERSAPSHVLILGEPGSGSAQLIETFLASVDQSVVRIALEPVGSLKGQFDIRWSHALNGTPQADFSVLRLNLPPEPLICVIEDLEYMDRTALYELTDFLKVEQDRVFFILKTLPGFFLDGRPERLGLLSAPLMTVEVPLLSADEMRIYLEGRAKGRRLPSLDLTRALNYAGGSVVLADDFLEPKGRAAALFVRLLAGLGEEEGRLLEAICVFPQEVTADRANLYRWAKPILMDRLRALCASGILIEADGSFRLRFLPLRRFVYDKIPPFYRAYLHELAASAQARADWTPRQIAADRAWHWDKAGDRGRALYFSLKEAELKLDFYDFIYPIRAESQDQPDHYVMERQRSYAALDALTQAVGEYQKGAAGEGSDQLARLVNYLEGRRLIAGGNQEEGIRKIDALIHQAKAADDPEYLLKGHIQRIHYGIQKEDLALIGESVALALHQTRSKGCDPLQRAEVLRLSGLYEYSRGAYARALEALGEADRILQGEAYRRNGFLARAATLSYIANTREALGDIPGADQAWQQAIALVEGRLHKCLDTLYADYGRFLYENGRIGEADVTLHRALEEFQTLGTHWKRPATEAILGLIHLARKDLSGAREHLVSAQIYHKADRRPAEEALIARLLEAFHAAGSSALAHR